MSERSCVVGLEWRKKGEKGEEVQRISCGYLGYVAWNADRNMDRMVHLGIGGTT